MAENETPEVQGLGHNRKRVEDARFIQGHGNYIDDIKVPGMLYLDIVRSPYAHAKITRIDSSKAMEIPGVLAVITGETLKKYNVHNMPTLMSDTQMVLPLDTVKYQFQEVAGVLATDRYIAADGVAAVEVDYDPLPVVIDPKKALEPGAPKVRDDKESNHIWHWEWGDQLRTDRAFSQAETVVSEDIYIPRIHVSSIETCGCIAKWDPIDQHLTLYDDHPGSPCHPHGAGAGYGSPRSVRRTYPGHFAGYRRWFWWQSAGLSGLCHCGGCSIVTGKPVKWIETRTENLAADSLHAIITFTPSWEPARIIMSTALRIKTIADHGYTDAAANPSKIPGRLVPHLHRFI